MPTLLKQFELQSHVPQPLTHPASVSRLLLNNPSLPLVFHFLVHQTVSTSTESKSRQSKVEALGGILDKMRVESKTKESNLGKNYRLAVISTDCARV